MAIKPIENTLPGRTLTRILADFGGRRKLYDRRLPPEEGLKRDRRSGIDRRSGFDRRSTTSEDVTARIDRRINSRTISPIQP